MDEELGDFRTKCDLYFGGKDGSRGPTGRTGATGATGFTGPIGPPGEIVATKMATSGNLDPGATSVKNV